MEKLFELTFQDQTLNPQVGTFTDASQTTGTFTLEDGEYYLTNGDTKGFYTYAPIAIQPDSETDNKVTVEFDLKVATASVNTHAIIGTYAGVDGSGIPTGAKIALQYNAGDIEMVLGGGTTATLIAAADVVVGQWYHFRIDCTLDAPTESTYQVKIDGTAVTTVTGTTADYALGIISVLGTDLHACDECGIKNIRLITDDDYFVGRTALNQAFTDTKGYVDNQVGARVPLAGSNAISGSLIPATDNSIDIGSSTKNLKMLYTKDITIDGTQFLPSDYVPRSGGAVITGWLGKTTDSSHFTICGATNDTKGAAMWLYGNDSPNYAGGVRIKLTDSNGGEHWFTLYPNGYAGWDGKQLAMNEDTVPRSGGAVITGDTIGRADSNNLLNLCGGLNWNTGATVSLSGKDASNNAGNMLLHPNDGTNDKFMYLKPDGTWTWNGTACQLVSDQRLKQQISEIDDKLLDAWGDVNLVQFKYNDAVDAKKDKARLHTGYVVQQIDSACKSHGVDVSAYGLYCHEVYPEETEEVEVEQKDGTKVKERKVIREASEHYSLRYTEVYAVECMYLRRCIARLTARIEELEKGKEQEAGK